jgi:hypothetical protein
MSFSLTRTLFCAKQSPSILLCLECWKYDAQTWKYALSAAVCPLVEDLHWRQQLADVTGPPDQDALPPLDRKVGALYLSSPSFGPYDCSASKRAPGRTSMPSVYTSF